MRKRASNFIRVQKKGFSSKRNHVLINQTVLILLTVFKKPIRDISINEFRNARKAIFKGINNGFMDESLNELPQENTQQFP